MVVHYCRDMPTYNGTNQQVSNSTIYFLALFLRRVLKYTQVGHTYFNVNSIGNLLIATGDANPTGSASWTIPNRASLVYNIPNVEVSIPVGVRTVSTADIDRVLVLKSDAYPKINSGVFRILGINTAQNRYIIDYRTFDTPTTEASTLEWYLYENDQVGSAAFSGVTPSLFPTSGTGNGSGFGFYNGSGPLSNTSRVILQSPHASGWQVRLCMECGFDWTGGVGYNDGTALYTVAPGFGGDSLGDFPLAGECLHGGLHLNKADTIWKGYNVGGGTNGTSTSHHMRIYIIGDESNVFIASRRVNDTDFPAGGFISFGYPENEPTPLPTSNIDRLYVTGSAYTSQGYGNAFYLNSQSTNVGYSCQGVAFNFGQIVTCTHSLLCYAYNLSAAVGSGPNTSSNATDSPFTEDTELTKIELLKGAASSFSISYQHLTRLNPKLMGTIPYMRAGRKNYGKFLLTTDANKSWLSLGQGTFVQWGGPSILP